MSRVGQRQRAGHTRDRGAVKRTTVVRTVAGISGYSVAILGLEWRRRHRLRLAVVDLCSRLILVAGCAAALIGMIAVRTAGIYTIMITLAVATAFFYFAQQNYSLFNGHSGFRGVQPPTVFGVDWRYTFV